MSETINKSEYTPVQKWDEHLDIRIFTENPDYESLKIWFEKNDKNIQLQALISREKWNEMQGQIIQRNWEEIQIFLPDDLEIWELPKIVKRINLLTFWRLIKDGAFMEMKNNMEIAINYLINNYKTLHQKLEVQYEHLKVNDTQRGRRIYNKNYKKYLAIRKAIATYSNDYFAFFQEPFKWNNSTWKYSQTRIMDNYNQKWKLSPVKSVAIAELLISNAFMKGLLESWWEHWIENIYTNIDVPTKNDWKPLDNKYKKHMYPAFENELDNIERNLIEKLKVQELVNRYKEIKKSDNDSIWRFEFETTTMIFKELVKYPMDDFLSKITFWLPQKSIDNKILICTTKSLLIHRILKQIWIKHDMNMMPSHAAISVYTHHDQEYFLDAINYAKIINVTNKEEDEWYGWFYKRILHDKLIDWEALIFKISPENGVIWNMLFNLWVQYWDQPNKNMMKLWLSFFKKSLYFFPNNPEAYYYISIILYRLWNSEDAYKNMKEARRLNPKSKKIKTELLKLLNIKGRFLEYIKVKSNFDS